jgi:hypothetical protein
MNKEGICSVFGYTAIYLIGVQLGHALFSTNAVRDWKQLLMRLVAIDVVLWLATYVLDLYVAANSRRMVCQCHKPLESIILRECIELTTVPILQPVGQFDVRRFRRGLQRHGAGIAVGCRVHLCTKSRVDHLSHQPQWFGHLLVGMYSYCGVVVWWCGAVRD